MASESAVDRGSRRRVEQGVDAEVPGVWDPAQGHRSERRAGYLAASKSAVWMGASNPPTCATLIPASEMA